MDFTQLAQMMQAGGGQQPGFGMGQQLVQPGAQAGGMGGQMAGGMQPGIMGQLAQAAQDPENYQKLMQLYSMFQQQSAGGANPMQQMQMQQQMGGRPAGQTQASVGYLANGGGFGPQNRRM